MVNAGWPNTFIVGNPFILNLKRGNLETGTPDLVNLAISSICLAISLSSWSASLLLRCILSLAIKARAS